MIFVNSMNSSFTRVIEHIFLLLQKKQQSKTKYEQVICQYIVCNFFHLDSLLYTLKIMFHMYLNKLEINIIFFLQNCF